MRHGNPRFCGNAVVAAPPAQEESAMRWGPPKVGPVRSAPNEEAPEKASMKAVKREDEKASLPNNYIMNNQQQPYADSVLHGWYDAPMYR